MKRHTPGAIRVAAYRAALSHKERVVLREKAKARWNSLSQEERDRRNSLHKQWFAKISPEQLAKYRQKRADAERQRVHNNRNAIMAKKRADYHCRQKNKQIGKCTMSHSCQSPLAGATRFCLKHWLVYIAAAASGHKRAKHLGKVNYMDLLSIWRKQKDRCAISGHLLIPGNGASLDHIIPIARGGTNDPSNLRFIYQTINRIKDDMLDTEFKAFLLHYWEPVIRWAKK